MGHTAMGCPAFSFFVSNNDLLLFRICLPGDLKIPDNVAPSLSFYKVLIVFIALKV